MAFVSVVIPTYNEREGIKSQIKKILEVTPNLLEVIVVDDDSPDGTWRIIEELGKEDERIRLLRRTRERGLASAIYNGVSKADGDIVMWLDSDHDPYPELVEKITRSFTDGADVCIASRYVKGGRELRETVQKIASMLVNYFASIVLDSSVHDYTTGFVATRKSTAQQ